MKPITISHPIDWNEHYHLVLTFEPDSKQLSGHVTGPIDSTGTVERHLATLIGITVGDAHYKLSLNDRAQPILNTTLNESDANDFTLNIHLGGTDEKDGEMYGSYHIHDAFAEPDTKNEHLTVFETRMLGNERLYRWLPYPRESLGQAAALEEGQEKPPQHQCTDLHTHSSAQISAQGLIDVAMNPEYKETPDPSESIPYPIRLLDELHIPYHQEDITVATRFRFPPIDGVKPIDAEEQAVPIALLDPSAREKLKAALAIPADRQVTFGDVEMTVYKYRTPIAKHSKANYGLLRKTAEEYQKQGIVYAEITATSSSLLTPEYIQFLHEKLPEIEKKTEVELRFLAGIPRNLPENKFSNEIEKLKVAGASPYIVGVDFMGFEDNKIGTLEKHIESIAVWAHEHNPEFTLRIHAGENRKNITNVKESLRLAQKYGMRVRIGHAAHGLDDEAMELAAELAERHLVMIEFNPDSNMALNNIDTAEELDILRCLDKKIPFVVCSDGGGLYQTDANQLWQAASFAAAFAGVQPSLSKSIVESEKEHIERAQKQFDLKKLQLPPDFFDRVAAAAALQPAPTIDTGPSPEKIKADFEEYLTRHEIQFSDASIEAATRGKKPLMILGATGERYWNMISANHRREIHAGIDEMLKKIDPAKVYFMIGRPKAEGITPLLSRAIQKYNSSPKHKEKFSLISATVQANQTKESFTPGLTHVLPLEGSLFTVPNQLVDYVKENDGHLLCIGGGTFVRDAILLARYAGASFGLMDGPTGASTDKAVMMKEEHQFSGADGMIKHLRTFHYDWFKAVKKDRSP